MSSESSSVIATSVDVTLPSSSIVLSSSQVESPPLATTKSIIESTTPFVPFTSSSLSNTRPTLTKSKHGIFKPKAYTVVRNYVQEEPPTFHVASRFPHWV